MDGAELNFKNKGITALLIFGLNQKFFQVLLILMRMGTHYNAHNIEASLQIYLWQGLE